MTSTINASHTLDPDEIEILGTAVPWGDRELRDLSHRELMDRFVSRFKLSYSAASPRATVLFGKLRGHAVSTVAPAPQARTVTLTDAECEVLGIEHTPEINVSTLTAKYQKTHRLSFEDAQNEAVRLMRKISDRGPDPRIAAFNEKVKYFTDRGYDHTDAQNYAARQLTDPTFNPSRDVENLSAPAQQAYSNTVAYLTALLQPPGSQGRTQLIQSLGNGNTLATLTAIANGWNQDYQACTTWAQKIMEKLQIGGNLPYERARAWAEQLTEGLVADANRTPNPLSPGVVPPAIGTASINRAGSTMTDARRLAQIDASQASLARIHSAQGRR